MRHYAVFSFAECGTVPHYVILATPLPLMDSAVPHYAALCGTMPHYATLCHTPARITILCQFLTGIVPHSAALCRTMPHYAAL